MTMFIDVLFRCGRVLYSRGQNINVFFGGNLRTKDCVEEGAALLLVFGQFSALAVKWCTHHVLQSV
jgi:hypothetical protein